MKIPTLTGIEMKAVVTFLTLVGVFVGYMLWHRHVFNAGMAAQQALDAENLESNRRIFGDTSLKVEIIGNLSSKEQIRIQTVTFHEVERAKAAVAANPDFSAIHRPAELARLRAEELAKVHAAADSSARAAAGGSPSLSPASSGSVGQPAGSH